MTRSLAALGFVIVLSSTVPLLRAQDWNPVEPEHEPLKLFAGDWELEVKNLEQKDQAPVKLRESSELVCKGIFVRSTVRGEVAGQPFEIFSLFGYDAHDKQYVGFGGRSDSHLPMTCSGSFDAKTKTFTLKGTKPSPQQALVPFRCEYVVVDDDQRRETIWRVGEDGKEMASTEITFRRVKGTAGTAQPASAGGPAFKSPRLLELAGTWAGAMKMEGAGMGGMEAEGEQACTLVCGGRWLFATSKINFGGMEGEMHQLLGVDETSKKVISVWIDSFGGHLDRADGLLGEGKTWLLEGKTRSPEGELCRYTEESSWKDDDHRVLRWVIDGGAGGEPMKIEIGYTRKK